MTNTACPNATLLGEFAIGRLADAERRSIRQHTKTCEACRKAIVDALRIFHEGDTVPAIALPAPRRAGRYELSDILGVGAMGVVYAALDPELGRRVAVKVLRLSSSAATPQLRSEEFRERFVRESRSLARVIHPNVVSIYDVGEIDGQVFIVMEMVEGGTLRDWLESKARSLPEILTMFDAIGRGLAAVHKAGLVHRDFKPENVLVGSDGRPRVTDFGLARGDGMQEDTAARTPSADREVVSLTQTGDLLGTPGYMALEQLLGQTADARADVFAFAVALWEAAFGVRPFSGNTLAELGANISSQRYELGASPPSGPVALLVPILKRALTARAADRTQTLEELLAELAPLRPKQRVSRLGQAAVGLLLVAGATMSALLVWQSKGAGRCVGNRFDDAWQSALRPSLAALAGSAQAEGSKNLAAQTLGLLDDYAARLRTMRQSSCEATFVTHAQSEPTFAAQTECLLRRQTRFELVIATASMVPTNWQRAADLSSRLDDPGECQSVAVLPRSAKPAAERERVLAALDRALNELDLGRTPSAIDATVTAARQLGDDSVLAEALLVHAQTRFREGNVDAARQILNEAIAAALTSRATDVALKAYAVGTRVFANGFKSVEDAERMARLFDELDASTGRGGPIRARVAAALADTYTTAGRHDDAMAVLQKAMASSDTPIRARAELGHALGKLLMNLGKAGAAAIVMDRAFIDAVAGFGPDSTATLAIMGERVWVDFGLGGPARALPGARRFVAQVERLGVENPRLLVDALHNLGAYLSAAELNDEALAVARRTAALAEANLPEDSPNRINPMISLASKLNDFHKEDEALPLLDRLRPVVDPVDRQGPIPSSAVFLNITYAHTKKARDPKGALEHLTRMRAQAVPFAKRPDVAAMLQEADEIEQEIRHPRPAAKQKK